MCLCPLSCYILNWGLDLCSSFSVSSYRKPVIICFSDITVFVFNQWWTNIRRKIKEVEVKGKAKKVLFREVEEILRKRKQKKRCLKLDQIMFLPSSCLSPLTSKGHRCERRHSSLHTCFACAISHIQSLISSAKSVREHFSLIKSVNHNCTMVAQEPLGCLEQFLTSLYLE